MTQHNFKELYDQYERTIKQMKSEFTSHEFILLLAQQNQVAYVQALNAYCDRSDSFRVVHGLLSKYLYHYKSVIKHMGNKDSDNIFWATWRLCFLAEA
jgi:hypothetical protein